ncbi:lipoprotein, partial [Entomoplasma luminosum]
MKKLLTLLGSILVFGGSVTTVVACTSQIIYFTPITSIE